MVRSRATSISRDAPRATSISKPRDRPISPRDVHSRDCLRFSGSENPALRKRRYRNGFSANSRLFTVFGVGKSRIAKKLLQRRIFCKVISNVPDMTKTAPYHRARAGAASSRAAGLATRLAFPGRRAAMTSRREILAGGGRRPPPKAAHRLLGSWGADSSLCPRPPLAKEPRAAE